MEPTTIGLLSKNLLITCHRNWQSLEGNYIHNFYAVGFSTKSRTNTATHFRMRKWVFFMIVSIFQYIYSQREIFVFS